MDFYRRKLKADAESEPFLDKVPERDEGREVILEEFRTAEEIMVNNPPY